MKAITSLKQFDAAFSMEPVSVKLEEFGKAAVFWLKPLTAADRDAFETSVAGVDGKRNTVNVRARLVAKCWVDETGKRVVPEAKVNQLGERHSGVVNGLFDEVMEMNGMTVDQIEDAEKN